MDARSILLGFVLRLKRRPSLSLNASSHGLTPSTATVGEEIRIRSLPRAEQKAAWDAIIERQSAWLNNA
jgi:hypothetical protein